MTRINNSRNKRPEHRGKRKVYVLYDKIKNNDSIKLSLDQKLSVDELITSGVVILNKPMGPTSHQVSAWVKNIFGVSKVGHGGTLDPRVTGVLPLAFGRTTKLLNLLSKANKEYVGVMRLHGDVATKEVVRVCEQFTGQIYQTPPVRSAVKRQLRIRTIYSFKVLEHKKRDVLFKVHCEAGTYIRSLVHDLGLVLSVGAHMQELRRTVSSIFHEDQAVTLQDLKDAWIYWLEDKDDTLLRKYLKPMEILLQNLPKVVIHDSAVDAICHGADLAIPGIIQFEDIKGINEQVAIITRKGEGVALGESLMDTKQILKEKSGFAVKTTRVLMETGKYEKGWKKGE